MKKEKAKKRVLFSSDTIRTRQKKIEWIYIAISAGLLLLSIIYTVTPLSIPVLNISLSSGEQAELFVNLFTVQATIAALSISIIAIITGFQTESVYGVTVTNYVTTLKPYFFKHKVLMIVDLIIIGINYALVSFELYNVSVMMFVISIMISCKLIWDTSFIFKSYSDIREEIGQYIKENINADFLKELDNSVNKNATSDNVARVEEELEFINDAFKSELDKANYSEKTLELIEKTLTNLFINSYLSNNKNMVFSILNAINTFYKNANSNKKKYPVDIWSIIYIEYLTFIGTATMAQLRNSKKFDFIEFKYNMEENQVFELVNGKIKEKNNFYLEYYYTWSYRYIVLKNQAEFEKEDCQYLKERILMDAYSDAFYSKKGSDLHNKRIIGLCYLCKTLIENGEITLLNNKYLRHEEYAIKGTDNSFVYIVNIIYSIYLAYEEGMVRETNEQKNAEAYLEVVRNNRISSILYHMRLLETLEEYIENFFDLMRTWEKMEERVVKTITLEPVIRNSLFFLCIEKYHDEKTLAKCFRIITSNHVESLVMGYFNSEKVFIERYKDFYKKLYNKEILEYDLTFKKELVRGALEREYKHELITTAAEKEIKSEKVNKYKAKLDDFFTTELEKYSLLNNKLKNITSTPIKFNIGHLIDEADFNRDDVSSWIKEQLSIAIFNAFIDCLVKYINIESVNYRSKNIQETLINLSAGIEPDIFIGNRETFWEEKDKNLLSNYVKDMFRIENSHMGNQLFLLNSSLIHFSVSDINYTVYDYTSEDFENLNVEYKDGKYYYSKYSNIMKVPFSEEELIEYLKKTKKHFKINLNVNFGIREEPIGCGIEIKYEDIEDDNERNGITDAKEQPSD